ncbi:hypothetical protein [Massilia eurypsychrophila]|uniref:hypothetical protein n=1 Tax=Massilia eurypsychrophila TaxID=1485217 RepID=UPI001033EEAC|nr:hypothetical protein [Massilia eurypsychrophila]
MRKLSLIALLGLGLCGSVDADEAPPSFADELRNGFYSRINEFGYVLRQDTLDSPLNPGNVLGIPRDQAVLELRPDFNLKFGQVEIDFKPRLRWTHTRVVTGSSAPLRSRRDEAFVNEGSVRYRLFDRLILSYGRENLQWGPSALLSPSNPFNANNGRNNPNLELPGMDYARAVLVASPAVTMSLIANTGRGRLDARERYRKAFAAKLDYTGDDTFFSLIGSRADGERGRIGAFAGWNVTDALSIRVEGSAGHAAGADVAATDRYAVERRDRQLLVGASYTTMAGPTMSAEYFFNKDGCADVAIELCLQRRGALLDPLRPLARRRYAMFQYVDTKIGGKLNLAVRAIRNLDDRSAQLIVSVEYELGEHWLLYAIPTYSRGSRASEFGSVLRRSLFVGASYTF